MLVLRIESRVGTPIDPDPERPAIPPISIPFSERRALQDHDSLASSPGPQGLRLNWHASRADLCDLALVTDRAGFEALQAEWNALFERAGRGTQVFQAFNWNWHWCNHYLASSDQAPDGPSLAIVVGRRDGRLVMVWPLVAERNLGLKQLIWMGEPVSQYGDVLIEDGSDTPAMLRAAWDFIRRTIAPDLVYLRKVRADAAVAPLLAEVDAFATQRLEAPYLDLADAKDFSAYEQRYSPRSRRNRRRLARRLAERGPMAFERHKSGDKAQELTRFAIALKCNWIKERGLVSRALSDPRMARFFGDVAHGLHRPTGCKVSALTSNGAAAAIEVTFACKDRVVMHVIVHDPKFEKAAPGVLLLEQTIAQAVADGCRTFDLLAPADGYKTDWADGVMEVNDWAKPLSLAGRVYARLYLGFAREVIKTALASLPISLRRFVAARQSA